MTVSMSTCFYVEQFRDVTVVCFTCRSVTERNYDVVAEELLEFVNLVTLERPIRVVAELLAIREIDVLGLEMLRAFHESIHDAGGRLVLCRVQPAVTAAIRRAGLPCEISGSRSEAVWSF